MPFIGKQPEVGAYSKLDAITTSATATYNLTLGGGAYYPSSANHLLVSLNGVMQAPQDSFTVSGSTIVFASTLASTDSIDFIMALGDVLDIGTPSDGTVTSSKLAGALTTPADLVVPDGSKLGVGNSNPARLLHLQLPSGVNGEMIRMSRAAGSYHMHLGVSADSDMIVTNNGSTEILRIMNQGGISFDTGSNILDDYEEGSGTNAQLVMKIGSTVVTTTGNGYKYTKIGNIVCFSFEFRATNTNSGSGEPNLTLPFVPSAGHYSAGVVRVYLGSVQGGEFLEVVPGDTGLRFKRNLNNAATGNMTITTNAYYYGSVVYRTDS